MLRLSPDGGPAVRVAGDLQGMPGIVFTDRDWVYYATYGENNDTYTSFFRARKDGSKTEELPQGFIRGYQIVGSTIYLSTEKKTFRDIRVKIDGSEARLVHPMKVEL